LTKDEYDAMTDAPVEQSSESVFAFAKAQLAEGNVNTAKYALASTCDATLADRHGRALTNSQIGVMAQDLEDTVLHREHLQEHDLLDHVPVNWHMPLLELVSLLDEHRSGFTVNLEKLRASYVERGLKRIPGTRDVNGSLIQPWLKTEAAEESAYVPVQSFEMN